MTKAVAGLISLAGVRALAAALSAVITCLALPFPHTAHAQSAFGLAMHGHPHHTAHDTHVRYANPDAPKGGRLVRSALGTFDTLIPYTLKGKRPAGLNLTFDTLMARSWDEPFTLYPLIAERYEIAPDRSWIRFSLDSRARFHDGSPITVEDVIFSFETLRAQGRPNMRQVYGLVEQVTRKGPRTVQFTFSAQHDQETALILAMMPVLPRKAFDTRSFDTTSLTPVLGSGPYQIGSVDPGRAITYRRVKDYWAQDLLIRKGHHNFDQLVYQYFRDDGVALEAFKSGEVTLRHEPNIARWMMAYDTPAFKRGELITQAFPHSRPVRAQGLMFNTRRAPFDDLRVRRALSFLLDEAWINTHLFHGAYTRIHSYYPNSELSADEISPRHDQDLTPSPKVAMQKRRATLRAAMRKAAQLLKEAGFVLKNGRYINTDTQDPLHFDIAFHAPADEKILLHFTRTLDKFGITARLTMMDSAAYKDRLHRYDFDMALHYWQSSLSPGTEQALYFSCMAGEIHGRWNFPGICSDEIDRLTAQIAHVKSRKALVQTVQALDAALIRGHYMIPLFYHASDNYAYWAPLQPPTRASLYGTVVETWWINSTYTQ